jgi:hypothetical protein
MWKHRWLRGWSTNRSRVKFAIDARGMKVLDPQLSPDKLQQVQQRMLGPEVLDSTRFPQIIFEPTNAEPAGQGRLVVGGLKRHLP